MGSESSVLKQLKINVYNLSWVLGEGMMILIRRKGKQGKKERGMKEDAEVRKNKRKGKLDQI